VVVTSNSWKIAIVVVSSSAAWEWLKHDRTLAVGGVDPAYWSG